MEIWVSIYAVQVKEGNANPETDVLCPFVTYPRVRSSGMDPLPWATRVQIALDSARGLEYIQEHTVPVYIHRDIKSANILIDQNFRGKVVKVPPLFRFNMKKKK